MGRIPLIKVHPHRKAIVSAVLRGVPVRTIAAKYGFSEAALRRYKNKYMPAQLKRAQEKDLELSAENLQEVVKALFKDAREFFAAAKADLVDPETGEVTWLPHANEIKIIYYIPAGDRQIRKKENLQALINQVMEKSKSTFGSFEWKYADARKEAARYLDLNGKLVETLAKLTGDMGEGHTSVVVNNTVLVGIKEVIINATKGHPKIRRQIVDRLERHIEESESVAE